MRSVVVSVLLVCFATSLADLSLASDEIVQSETTADNIQSDIPSGELEWLFDYWPQCKQSRENRSQIFKLSLCDGSSGRVSRTVHRLLADLLDAEIGSKEALCVIDSATVLSQSVCQLTQNNSNVDIISDILRRLARNWHRFRELIRAEQLLQAANKLLDSVNRHDSMRRGVLRELALLELEIGKVDFALELARRNTQYAREHYENSLRSPVTLVRALQLEAIVLERMGRLDESRAALKEATELASLPDPCLGESTCECEKDDLGKVDCRSNVVPVIECNTDSDGKTDCTRVQ